jgi:hypothetical protein
MDEKLQTVLKYAGNDQDRARKIMSGDLKDVRVVNGAFSVPAVEMYSQFQIFFNIESEELLNITMVMFKDKELYNKIQVEDAWKLFYTKTKQAAEDKSVTDSTDILMHLTESIEGYQVVYDVQDKDQESVELSIKEIVQKSLSVEEVQVTISMFDLSTLDLVENNVPLGKLLRRKEEKASVNMEEEKSEIENQAQFTVDSSLLIAPVSGKNIYEIVPGDLLKVIMNNKNDVTRKIAKALNAIDDGGEFLPIKGRVKEITQLPQGGYRIYCLIAKGILAKIIEEEDIKAELFIPEAARGQNEKGKIAQLNLLIYGVLIAFILIVAIIIIVAIL